MESATRPPSSPFEVLCTDNDTAESAAAPLRNPQAVWGSTASGVSKTNTAMALEFVSVVKSNHVVFHVKLRHMRPTCTRMAAFRY